jgi:hypothetical protein
MATPDIWKLDLSDDEDTENLWTSYSRPTAKTNTKHGSNTLDGNRAFASIPGESQYDAEQAREEALKRELEGVRNINEVVEGVISSLEHVKGSMDICFAPP